jgi:hypothetical protein
MSKQSTSILALSGYDASLLAAWPPARKERSAFFLHLQWFIERVHVLVMAAPLAGAVVAARYGNNVLNKSKPFGYQSPMDATALPPLITMAAFVMGSVLSNVMSDFKESEKIPAELQGYFQALVSFATTECRSRGMSELPALEAVQDMLLCVMAHVDSRVQYAPATRCYEAAWQRYCQHLLQAAHSSSGMHIELENTQHSNTEIVKKWARINDISKNSIVLPAYMLMDLITCLLIGVLVDVYYKDISETTGYWATGIFATIVIYMNLFIRQLDDPFAWPEGYWYQAFANGGELETSLLDTLRLVCNVNMGCVVSVWQG